MTDEKLPPAVPLAQAAAVLRISESSVRRMVSDGRLTKAVWSGRSLRVDQTSLRRAAADRGIAVPACAVTPLEPAPRWKRCERAGFIIRDGAAEVFISDDDVIEIYREITGRTSLHVDQGCSLMATPHLQQPAFHDLHAADHAGQPQNQRCSLFAIPRDVCLR
jgi:hypothetical protein